MQKENEQYEDYLEGIRKQIEPFTVEQLEAAIVAHWNANDERVDDELKIYLDDRKWKINDTFVWTPENIEKLLHLNRKLINCFEKFKNEATPVIKKLQKRMDENDDCYFYTEACITPDIYMRDENGNLYAPENGLEMILTESINDCELNVRIRNEDDLNSMIYLNKEMNWCKDWHFKGNFEGHFISQAIHDLYSHTFWSFPDILKINHLEMKWQVVQYHNEDV